MIRRDPDKVRALQERSAQTYAARRREPSRRKPSDSAWRAAVAALRGLYCRRCHTTRNLECDHVIPRGRGGPSVVENGTFLCRDCHRLKTDSRIKYRHDWLDPDQIMWLAAEGWVTWGPDGQPHGRSCRTFEPQHLPPSTRREQAEHNPRKPR